MKHEYYDCGRGRIIDLSLLPTKYRIWFRAKIAKLEAFEDTSGTIVHDLQRVAEQMNEGECQDILR